MHVDARSAVWAQQGQWPASDWQQPRGWPALKNTLQPHGWPALKNTLQPHGWPAPALADVPGVPLPCSQRPQGQPPQPAGTMPSCGYPPPPPSSLPLPVEGAAAALQRSTIEPFPANVLTGASMHNSPRQQALGVHDDTGRKPCKLPSSADSGAAAAAAAAAALTACRQLNKRLRAATNVKELFAALEDGWQSLDCINLSTCFHRLGQFAEAVPGGPAAFRRHIFASASSKATYGWLLDNLPQAAQALEFDAQCISNTLAALCKLDALSPSLLQALHAPLLRALSGGGNCSGYGHCYASSRDAGSAAASSGASPPAGPSQLNSRGLSQVMWAFGKDDGLQPLLLALKPQLFQALWAAAPTLDAQGIATVWWALAEVSSRCTPDELHLAAEAPGLLPRLATAAQAAGSTLVFQGLSQVLHACTKIRPEPYKDEALLQALATAASRRLQDDPEQPTPQAAGLICLAFGRLGFTPRCHWCTSRALYSNVLDDLGVALLANLQQAKPQELCSYLQGLGLLEYGPPAHVLRGLLAHLSKDCQQALHQTSPEAGSKSLQEGEQVDGEVICQESNRTAQGSQRLVLEQYSSAELADLVNSLGRILRGGRQYPDNLLPSSVLEEFFDAWDTVLRVRLAMAADLGSGTLPSELALTGQHMGTICHALRRLANTPGATLTEETVLEVERHLAFCTTSYSATSLASVLHFFATQGLQLGMPAAEAACTHVLAILEQQRQQQQQQPCLLPPPQRQHIVQLGTLAKLMWALVALQLSHPPLLRALLPAASASLAVHEQEVQRGGSPPASIMRELVILIAALGQHQAAGMLAPAGLASAEALLPFWHTLMGWVGLADVCAGGGSGAGLQPQDAHILQQAAAQLDDGLAGSCGMFWLPPAVQRTLATAPTPTRHQQQAQQQDS